MVKTAIDRREVATQKILALVIIQSLRSRTDQRT